MFSLLTLPSHKKFFAEPPQNILVSLLHRGTCISIYFIMRSPSLKEVVPILTCEFSTLNWLTLNPKTHFAQFYLGYFSFSLLGQKHEYDTGDEAVMKIHKKIKIGIPVIGTFCAIISKVWWIWSWNFGIMMRKIWAFIGHQKKYYFPLSPVDENVIGTNPLSLKNDIALCKYYGK